MSGAAETLERLGGVPAGRIVRAQALVADRVHNVDVSSSDVEVIRRLNAAFNAGDYEAFQRLLDRDVEFVDHLPLPDVAQEARGVEEVRTVLEQWREGFSGFRAEVEEYIDCGDHVVCATRWRFVSRDRGIEMDWRGAEAHQVRDGKLVWSAVGFRDVQAAIDAVEQRQTGTTG